MMKAPMTVRALTVVVLAGTALIGATGSAHAEPVPFTDPNAHGYIGLCDSAGHSLSAGLLSDKPFVVRAVSSVAAPKGYGVKQGAKASLYAYQPINGIDPGNWSGQLMNGSSFFSSDDHPMTASTVLDYSMGDFVRSYPPKWDGLVQLRLFYGAPNQSTYLDEYPATVLKITGDTWRVVQGGNADCSAGKVISTETLLLPKSKFAEASASIAAPGGATLGGTRHDSVSLRGAARSADAAGATAGGAANTSSRGATPVSSGAGAASSASTASASPVAGRRDVGGTGTIWTVLGVIAGLGAVGAVGMWLLRRRSSVRARRVHS